MASARRRAACPTRSIVDGVEQDLGEVEYLLSPKDLVGLDAIPALAEIGVASLKIEGRLKGPVTSRRRSRSTARSGRGRVGELAPAPPVDIPLDRDSLHVAYSRGISSGFLAGADHQTLVEGRFPRHRGLPTRPRHRVDGEWVTVVDDPAQRPVTGGRSHVRIRPADATVPHAQRHAPDSDVRAGMGVVFDRGQPEKPEQGGPIFGVEPTREGHRLRFGRPGPDLSKVSAGDFVWVSSIPR